MSFAVCFIPEVSGLLRIILSVSRVLYGHHLRGSNEQEQLLSIYNFTQKSGWNVSLGCLVISLELP